MRTLEGFVIASALAQQESLSFRTKSSQMAAFLCESRMRTLEGFVIASALAQQESLSFRTKSSQTAAFVV